MYKNAKLYFKLQKKLNNWCRIYFETIFAKKLLVNFTNNYKEMAHNTLK